MVEQSPKILAREEKAPTNVDIACSEAYCSSCEYDVETIIALM